MFPLKIKNENDNKNIYNQEIRDLYFHSMTKNICTWNLQLYSKKIKIMPILIHSSFILYILYT